MANWTEDDLRQYEQRLKAHPSPPPIAGPVEDQPRGPVLNKTEQKFAQYLDLQVRAGAVKRWWFGEIQYRVGERCWWLADFTVEYPDGRVVIYDTKGEKKTKVRKKSVPRAEDDAIVKARCISDKFPWPVYFTWLESKTGEWLTRRM